jgi:predicted nucleotidyltransferase
MSSHKLTPEAMMAKAQDACSCARVLLEHGSADGAVNIDHETLETVRRFLELIRDRYDVAGAILYGSRARGTHNAASDVDVAVILNGEYKRFDALRDMSGIAFDIMLDTELLISPLPLRLDDWKHPENSSNPELLRNIDREGVRV